MQVAPHVGWANAVPDAQANVQLIVNGRPLNFTGIGYHDKVSFPADLISVNLANSRRTGATRTSSQASDPGTGATAAWAPTASSGSTSSPPNERTSSRYMSPATTRSWSRSAPGSRCVRMARTRHTRPWQPRETRLGSISTSTFLMGVSLISKRLRIVWSRVMRRGRGMPGLQARWRARLMGRRLRARRCSSIFTFLRSDLLAWIGDPLDFSYFRLVNPHLDWWYCLAWGGGVLALSISILHSLPFVYYATFCLVYFALCHIILVGICIVTAVIIATSRSFHLANI